MVLFHNIGSDSELVLGMYHHSNWNRCYSIKKNVPPFPWPSLLSANVWFLIVLCKAAGKKKWTCQSIFWAIFLLRWLLHNIFIIESACVSSQLNSRGKSFYYWIECIQWRTLLNSPNCNLTKSKKRRQSFNNFSIWQKYREGFDNTFSSCIQSEHLTQRFAKCF